MATIHFILQGKGGVGKSMVASFLYQSLRNFGKNVIAYDTDPVNATLAAFKEFNVTTLAIMRDGNIDARKFDALLEALVSAPEGSHVIVDNGASSFIALGDTIQGLVQLVRGFPDSPLVIWLNPFFGEIAIDGMTFEDFKIYKDHSQQFHALIRLPEGNRALIGKDLEDLLAKRQSFEAGINGSSTSIAVKARLKRYWNQFLSCVEQADIL